MAVDVFHKASAEAFQKLYVGILCRNAEVDVVSCRRHISFDYSLCVIGIVGMSVNVYLLVFLVPFHVGVQRSHASVLEFELVYSKVGIGIRRVEY